MNDHTFSPSCAERLAAYFDGTLPHPDRQRVEGWLADHPEVAADFASLQRLQRSVRSISVPEPSDNVWACVRERIEQGLAKASVGTNAASRRFGWGGAWWAAAAAGIFLVAALPNWRSKPNVAVVEEAFVVASADDVEILSVDAAGARSLLVGEPPLPKPMVLMAAGDATLKSVEIVPAGQFPEVWMGPGEQESPMIVAPFVAGQLNTP